MKYRVLLVEASLFGASIVGTVSSCEKYEDLSYEELESLKRSACKYIEYSCAVDSIAEKVEDFKILDKKSGCGGVSSK